MATDKRLTRNGLILSIIFLSACSSSNVDKSLFDSSDEAAKNILNDSYMVEEQQKLNEYKPDGTNSKSNFSKKIGQFGQYGKSKNSSKNKGAATTKTGNSLNGFALSTHPDWKEQEIKSQQVWKQFSQTYLKQGERQVFNVSYGGISAASVVLEVMPIVRYQSRDVFHFHARAKTADFYKWIYSLNDTIDSLVDREHFVSMKYSLLQNEKNKNIEDIQYYDRKSLMTYSYYKKTKEGKVEEEKKQQEIPFYGQDYFSSFFFVRGLPLKTGDQYLFPTTTKGKTWLMSIKVEGREKLDMDFGKIDAIKLELITNYAGELAKKGPIHLWISDNEYRAMLRASAEVKIGSIKLELIQYRLGEQKIYGQ